jgi:tetratricopeptide (TPR) repeat protein
VSFRRGGRSSRIQAAILATSNTTICNALYLSLNTGIIVTRNFIFRCILFTILAAGCGQKSSNDLYSEGMAAATSGDYETGVSLLTQAIEQGNKTAAAYGNRGNCYSYLGNVEAAIADFDKARDITIAGSGNQRDPYLAYILYNRGLAYQKGGKLSEAIADYESTLLVNADYPSVRNNLAWILATASDSSLRNPQKSLELILQEYQPGKSHPSLVDTVAACYAANGDFAEAVKLQEEVVRQSDTRELNKRLRLYKSGKPYIDLNE